MSETVRDDVSVFGFGRACRKNNRRIGVPELVWRDSLYARKLNIFIHVMP